MHSTGPMARPAKGSAGKSWSFTSTARLPTVGCEGGPLAVLCGQVLAALRFGPEGADLISVGAAGARELA